MDDVSTRTIANLTAADNHEVRELILAGLAERWGTLDPTLNPDLDDMLSAYGHGQTIVVRDANELVATGTVVPTKDGAAKIVRMSVRSDQRRRGLGRLVVEELCRRARERGFNQVVLETSTAWTDAVEFYVGCGFEITHLSEGVDPGTHFRRDL